MVGAQHTEQLEARQIATGYGFLEREAAFDVSESVIDYSPADSYFKVLVVGVLNTLKVSVIGIVLATLIGTLFGVARLSSNWLIARIAGVYVEGLRNIPLLLQLFFWYALITQAFPGPRKALNPIEGIFLSNRGLNFRGRCGKRRIPWVSSVWHVRFWLFSF